VRRSAKTVAERRRIERTLGEVSGVVKAMPNAGLYRRSGRTQKNGVKKMAVAICHIGFFMKEASILDGFNNLKYEKGKKPSKNLLNVLAGLVAIQ
jgi:hypothetical protein